jgi:hypothetical protein
MFRAKLIGTAMEVLAEVLDTMDIGTDGCLGEVVASQLLNHALT